MKLTAAMGAVALAASLGGCGFDVIYADWKVDQLCKADGGTKIFVQAKAPTEILKSNGGADLDALLRGMTDKPYYIANALTDIKVEDPRIFRSEYGLYRRADNLLMGTTVVYHRAGQNTSIPLLARRPYKCPPGSELGQLIEGVFGIVERAQ